MPQVGQGQAHAQEQVQHPDPEHQQTGALDVDRLTQLRNLAADDSRATIYEGGLFSE